MNTTELQTRVETYFAQCDATRRDVTKKDGTVSVWQLPYTFYGLCAALGESAARLLAQSQGRGAGARILRCALHRIAAHLAERALLGDFPHQMVLPLLRETGFLPESAEEGERVWEVRMDARAEELGR
ncbi:MAG: DNA-packaging protein [Clostridiales bacterium]|nr:DNA-packaging protein [Clostridiales bacterium]